MTQDDRMETITDPAEIRATDEPDERTPNEVHVDESGCSCKTGPYRGFQRDPIDPACPKHGEPLRHGDGDVTVCHPDGSTTIIREPDERGDFPCCADRAHKESLGGDSESGTYNRSNQPPAESRPDADNPWALLPDDHPKRPKQCGGCGTKWVDAETARACERRHGDDIATTPAPVGAAVELDLDAIEARVNAATPGPWWVEQVGDFGVESAVIECVRWRGYLNTLHLGEDTPTAEFIAHAREDVPALVAEVRRLTAEAATQREWFEAADAAADRRLDQSIAWMERAEAAEAEVVTLRAKVAEGRRIVGMLAETVVSECEDDPEMCHGHDRTDDGRCPLLVDLNRAHAALAVTTGEGQ